MLTEMQLRQRAHSIGASEIAAVVGVSPWSKPIDVWLEKTGRGRASVGNAKTRAGHYLERSILTMYADQAQATIFHPQEVWPSSEGGTMLHPDYSYLSATPDGVAVVGGTTIDRALDDGWLVDAKNVGFFQKEHWVNTAPVYYYLQIIQQMAVTGLKKPGKLVALVGGQDLVVQDVFWDDEIAEVLYEAASRFWFDHVMTDIPPPIDGSAGWSSWIAQKLPETLEPTRAGTDEEAELVREIAAARDAKKVLDAQIDLCDNRLKALIGASRGVYGKGWKATWQDQTSRVSWKDVAADLGSSLSVAVALHFERNDVPPSEVTARTTELVSYVQGLTMAQQSKVGARKFVVTYKDSE